jgi:hypothetical protein
MEGLGEMSLDFSFEDLEFIGEESQEGAAEEGAAAEAAEESAPGAEQAADATIADEAAAVAAAAAEQANNGATDVEGQESVSGESTESNTGDEGNEGTSPKLYSSLASVLKEKGVITSVDDSFLDSVKDADSLVDLIKKQIQEEELKDLSESQRTVLKGMREGVSSETASVYQNAMTKLNGITDEVIGKDDQVRFDLIYQNFLSKGFDKDKASKYANRSFQLKEDVADAKEAKAGLVSAVEARYESSKAKEVQGEKDKVIKAQKEKDELKNIILKEEEPIKGFKIPENVRKEIYSEMVTTVSTDPTTGEAENGLMKYKRENPEEYNHRLYYLYKVTNGFQDMKYFNNKATSSSVNKLESAIRSSTHVSGGGNPTFADDGNSHILDIGDLILPGQE